MKVEALREGNRGNESGRTESLLPLRPFARPRTNFRAHFRDALPVLHRTGTVTRDIHIALLRGINVGKSKRVAMGDLRALLEQLGYGDVRTLLNSSNVVFSGPVGAGAAAGARIEKAMAARLHVAARVTVITAAELATIISENPLIGTATNPSRYMVSVLANPAHRRRLAPLAKQDWRPEAFAMGARVAYLWCPDGILASRLHVAVARALGDGVTGRNWATMTKLHALVQGLP